MIFLADDAEITDLAWGRGLLWLACKAGYSSALYALDAQAGAVTLCVPARGPEPTGIAFDAQEEHFWTVDARNREFSQFTLQGAWTRLAIPTPIQQPMRLALDDNGRFWTVDGETNRVYQIAGER